MIRLSYTLRNDLGQLHDELLAALPALAGTWTNHVEINDAAGAVRERVDVDEPNLRVEGNGDTVTLTVPDDTDVDALATVVKNHTPRPPAPEAPTGTALVQGIAVALAGATDFDDAKNRLLEVLEPAPPADH